MTKGTLFKSSNNVAILMEDINVIIKVGSMQECNDMEAILPTLYKSGACNNLKMMEEI